MYIIIPKQSSNNKHEEKEKIGEGGKRYEGWE
jgi:hypothetical protein